MKKSFLFYLACSFVLILSFTACSSNQDAPSSNTSDVAASKEVETFDTVSMTRLSVSEDPVASYSKKTDDPLNDWYFRVRIYETPATFKYLLKMQFEEIRGEDTLKIPNLGIEPKVVIEPGKEQYSCIIGFLDKEGNFREYKKVYVKNNSLKVTTLRHYSVRNY